MSAPTLARPIPVDHFAYMQERSYRRQLHALIRRAIDGGIKFDFEWRHSAACCTLQPQDVTMSNLIDQLAADGVVVWKVEP